MENQMPQQDSSRAGATENAKGPMTAANEGQASSGPKRGWSKKKAFLVILIVAVAWFAGVQIMAAERYSAVVNVIEGVDKVGVNPSAERLDFGDLSRDTGASRFVTLKNNGRVSKSVFVVKRGKIAELMKTDQSSKFTIRPGEEIKLEFNVRIPVSAPYGSYTGSVLIFKWPKLF